MFCYFLLIDGYHIFESPVIYILMEEDQYINILKTKLETKTTVRRIYFGRIVNKKTEQRMNFSTLNSVLFTTMPPLYKFKIFNDEIYYAQAINKLSSFQPKKYKEKFCIGYSGVNEVYRDIKTYPNNIQYSNIPVYSLYIYHPKKNYDVFIEGSVTRNEIFKEIKLLEELDKDILEYDFQDVYINCSKAKNSSNSIKYEVCAILKPTIEFSDVLSLIHNMFDDTYLNKRY